MPPKKVLTPMTDDNLGDWEANRYPFVVCRVRQEPERAVPDPNRWLLRKLADAVFNFLGYQRIVKPFRDRQWD